MSDHTSRLPLFATPPDDLPQIVPITNQQVKDLTRQRFGRLAVIGYVGSDQTGRALWLCQCDCGNRYVVPGKKLRQGHTRSCGCMYRRFSSHGMSLTPEYRVWRAILDRCMNPNVRSYPRYGGRGIIVCERWQESFDAFLADMGPKPGPRHTVDRVDNDLGYSPENCRWATLIEQANNKRNNRHLEWDGERLTLSQWAKKTGITQAAIYLRLKKGWNTERTLTTPLRVRPKR